MYIDCPQNAIKLNSVSLICDDKRWNFQKIKTAQVHFPAGIGDGMVQTVDVRPGITLTISDFMFFQDVIMEEEYTEKEIFQIYFCLDGGLEWCYLKDDKEDHFFLGAQQCQVSYGTVRQCRSIHQGGRRCRFVNITLGREIFEQIFSLICARDALCGTNFDGIARIYLYTSNVSKILSEIVNCPYYDELKKIYVEGKILELIAVFCDEVICQSPVNLMGITITRAEYEALLKAKMFINHNFVHPLTIAEVAQKSAISEKRLTVGFRQCFGCTVNEYIKEKRIETAKGLLLTGKYTVSNVAWMVGYSHTGYFIRVFREHYGISPGEMLKNNK